MAGSEVFIKFISCDYVPTLFCKAEILQGEICCRLRLIACKQALLGALGSGEKNSFSSAPAPPPTLYPQRPPCCSVQHEGGKEPRTIGAGGVWEAEAKKAGGGISKREGSGGNMGQLPNDAKYFAIEKGLK